MDSYIYTIDSSFNLTEIYKDTNYYNSDDTGYYFLGENKRKCCVSSDGSYVFIPITNEVNKLLNRIAEVEKIFGYYGDYVFMNEHGRINKRILGDCARNKSLQAGLPKAKGTHCYRRTVNSTIKCNGVSSTIASSLLGNTEEVNDNFYTYDVTDMEQKRIILEQANEIMLGKCN